VIDRNHLNTLMREQQLTSSGLLNRLMTRKLEVDGVQALVTGSLTPFGEEEVRVSVKILDVSTAKMLGVNQVNLVQNATIKNMMRQGIAANEVVTAQQTSGGKPGVTSGKSAAKSSAMGLTAAEEEEAAEAEPQLTAEASRVRISGSIAGSRCSTKERIESWGSERQPAPSMIAATSIKWAAVRSPAPWWISTTTTGLRTRF
jgi:hypothetical protein